MSDSESDAEKAADIKRAGWDIMPSAGAVERYSVTRYGALQCSGFRSEADAQKYAEFQFDRWDWERWR